MKKASQQRVRKPVTAARTPQHLRPTATALAIAACFSGSLALANPTTPTVVNGIASFAQAGNILNITNSPNAIINWGSFSIGVNELTRFLQQSASSAVLNRVIGQDPSAILGALQSNGKVFLLNPNGIVFGAGSQINVAGLVASTLNLSNEDFLANRMRFTDGAGAGSVVNQGSITGGSVYLVGKAVTNDGLITSPQGEVILAAGNSVELVNPGTPNLRVEIVAPDNEARNLGTITADAGRIGIYAGLINNSGTLNASSAVAEGGRIVLKATKNTTLASSSILDASGVGGGRIDVLADDTVYVDGRLDASAPNGGNGGFIETSGKNRVKIAESAFVTTNAPQGQTGTWLIDPTDFVIAASGGDTTGSAIASSLGSTAVVISSYDGSGSYGGGNGDILVQDPINWSSSNSLTLTARRNVQVDAQITNSGTGGLNLYAGWNGTTGTAANPTLSLPGDILVNALIDVGRTINMAATGTIAINAAVSANGRSGGGDATVTLSGGTINIGAVPVTAYGGNGGSGEDGGDATVTMTATGGLTVNSGAGVRAYGGAGGYGSSESSGGGAGGRGGHAKVELTSGGTMTINGTVQAVGGWGASGSGGGGDGGKGIVKLTSSSGMTLTGAQILADGGEGAYSGTNSGAATITLTAAGPITVTGGLLRAHGGSGSESGGNGGDANVTVESTGGSVTLSGTQIYALGEDGDFNFGAGGAGKVEIKAAGAVSVVSSTLRATGGDGGETASAGAATVTVTGGAGITVSSSSNITASAGDAGSGQGGAATVALGTSGGDIQIDGSEGYAFGGSGATGGSAVVALLSAGGITVSNFSNLRASAGSGNSGYGPAAAILGAAGNIALSSNANIYSTGDVGIAGANVSLDDATVSASGSLVVGATGNLDVMNVSALMGSGNATIGVLGNVTVDNSIIAGNPDVVMSVGGVINMNNGGTIQAEMPMTIYLTFPMLTSGGYFVNGVEGVVYDPLTLTGFLAGGSEAILGTNLLVTYGGGNLSPPTDVLIIAMGESITPPEPEKDKDIFDDVKDDKKNAPVCR